MLCAAQHTPYRACVTMSRGMVGGHGGGGESPKDGVLGDMTGGSSSPEACLSRVLSFSSNAARKNFCTSFSVEEAIVVVVVVVVVVP